MDENKLWELAEETNEPGWAIAAALLNLAYEVKYLGNGNAATQVGAIEGFGMHLGEKLDSLTNAISDISMK